MRQRQGGNRELGLAGAGVGAVLGIWMSGMGGLMTIVTWGAGGALTGFVAGWLLGGVMGE